MSSPLTQNSGDLREGGGCCRCCYGRFAFAPDYIDLVTSTVNSRAFTVSVCSFIAEIFLTQAFLGSSVHTLTIGFTVPEDRCDPEEGMFSWCTAPNLGCGLWNSFAVPLVKWIVFGLALTMLRVNSTTASPSMVHFLWSTFIGLGVTAIVVGQFYAWIDALSFLMDDAALEAFFSTSNSTNIPALDRYMVTSQKYVWGSDTTLNASYCATGPWRAGYTLLGVAKHMDYLGYPYRSFMFNGPPTAAVNLMNLFVVFAIASSYWFAMMTWVPRRMMCSFLHERTQSFSWKRHTRYMAHVKKLLRPQISQASQRRQKSSISVELSDHAPPRLTRGTRVPPSPDAERIEPLLVPQVRATAASLPPDGGGGGRGGEAGDAMKAVRATPVLTGQRVMLSVTMGAVCSGTFLVWILVNSIAPLAMINKIPSLLSKNVDDAHNRWAADVQEVNDTLASLVPTFNSVADVATAILYTVPNVSIEGHSAAELLTDVKELNTTFNAYADQGFVLLDYFYRISEKYYRTSDFVEFAGRFVVSFFACLACVSIITLTVWNVWVLRSTLKSFRRDIRLCRLLGFRGVFTDQELGMLALTDASSLAPTFATQMLVGSVAVFVIVAVPIGALFFVMFFAPAPRPFSEESVSHMFWGWVAQSQLIWVAVIGGALNAAGRWYVKLKVQNGYVVQYRRVFMWWETYMMFCGMFVSLFSALLKLIVPVIFLRVFYFARADLKTFPAGFEGFDMAHRAYVASVWMEVLHNNPGVWTIVCVLHHFKHTRSPPHVPIAAKECTAGHRMFIREWQCPCGAGSNKGALCSSCGDHSSMRSGAAYDCVECVPGLPTSPQQSTHGEASCSTVLQGSEQEEHSVQHASRALTSSYEEQYPGEGDQAFNMMAYPLPIINTGCCCCRPADAFRYDMSPRAAPSGSPGSGVDLAASANFSLGSGAASMMARTGIGAPQPRHELILSPGHAGPVEFTHDCPRFAGGPDRRVLRLDVDAGGGGIAWSAGGEAQPAVTQVRLYWAQSQPCVELRSAADAEQLARHAACRLCEADPGAGPCREPPRGAPPLREESGALPAGGVGRRFALPRDSLGDTLSALRCLCERAGGGVRHNIDPVVDLRPRPRVWWAPEQRRPEGWPRPFWWWLLVTLHRNPELCKDRKHAQGRTILFEGPLEQKEWGLWLPRVACLTESRLVLYETPDTAKKVLENARKYDSRVTRSRVGSCLLSCGWRIVTEIWGAGGAQDGGAGGGGGDGAEEGTWKAGRADGAREVMRFEFDEYSHLTGRAPEEAARKAEEGLLSDEYALQLRRRCASLAAARASRDRELALAVLSTKEDQNEYHSALELRTSGAEEYAVWHRALTRCVTRAVGAPQRMEQAARVMEEVTELRAYKARVEGERLRASRCTEPVPALRPEYTAPPTAAAAYCPPPLPGGAAAPVASGDGEIIMAAE